MDRIMPMGVSDFKKIIDENYYFVDKSLLIKEIIDSKANVLLITRPRRFGKTLNLNMIRRYFENTSDDNRYLFKGLKIDNAGERYKKYQCEYPVIFMSLKDTRHVSWYDTLKKIKGIIQSEYDRFNYIMTSDFLSRTEKKYFKRILDGKAEKVEYENSLEKLTLFIKKYHGVESIVLIDEYDVAIQSGFMNGFYDEVNNFMKNWLSSGLKDNNDLKFAVLTGILQVSKESIFSSFNNLESSTVLSEKYSEYFGFTQTEVENICSEFNKLEKLSEIKKWYKGYNFGSTEIYNPWSIVSYFRNNFAARAYWLDTGKDDIMYEFIKDADNYIKQDLKKLIEKKSVESIISDNIVYNEILKSKANLYSFLVLTGYLKTSFKNYIGILSNYNLKIPNKEISYTYYNGILSQISDDFTFEEANKMLEFLSRENICEFENIFRKLFSSLLNEYNATEEFYNSFMLIMTTLFIDSYEIKCDTENTYEQFCLTLISKSKYSFAIIIKSSITYRMQYIVAKAQNCLNQITNEYGNNLNSANIKKIYKYGIAFCDNQFEICKERA